jgi:hypothetical protein
MRLISVAYFPYDEADNASELIRAKIADYKHFWVRQGRFALVSSTIDPQSLLDTLKPFLGEFDTLLVTNILDRVYCAGADSDELWEWADRYSTPY